MDTFEADAATLSKERDVVVDPFTDPLLKAVMSLSTVSGNDDVAAHVIERIIVPFTTAVSHSDCYMFYRESMSSCTFR